MASRMMRASASRNQDLDAVELMSLLGRLYQLRDDYNDIAANAGGAQDDLDEGSFTLPLIHALQQGGDAALLQSILQARGVGKGMAVETKLLVREILDNAGSLEFTREAIRALYVQTRAVLSDLEEGTKVGGKNWMLRLLVFQLKI